MRNTILKFTLALAVVVMGLAPCAAFAWGTTALGGAVTKTITKSSGTWTPVTTSKSSSTKGFSLANLAWNNLPATVLENNTGVKFSDYSVFKVVNSQVVPTQQVQYSWAGGTYTGFLNNSLSITGTKLSGSESYMTSSVRLNNNLVWSQKPIELPSASSRGSSVFSLGTDANQNKLSYFDHTGTISPSLVQRFDLAAGSTTVTPLDDMIFKVDSERVHSSFSLDSLGTVTDIKSDLITNNNLLKVQYGDQAGKDNSNVRIDVKDTYIGVQQYYAPFVSIKNPYGGPDVELNYNGVKLSHTKNGQTYTLDKSTNGRFISDYAPALTSGNVNSITFNIDGSLDINYTSRYDSMGNVVSQALQQQQAQSLHIPSSLSQIDWLEASADI